MTNARVARDIFAQNALKNELLKDLLSRYNLTEKWRQNGGKRLSKYTAQKPTKSSVNGTKNRQIFPTKGKVRLLLQMQREVLLIVEMRRPPEWYEKPWDIEP